MQLELEGITVLVTGGSKGIGLACARAFAQEGARVAIASRSVANLDRAAAALAKEGHEVVTGAADLRDAVQARQMTRTVEERLGRVGLLVNSAGAAARTPAPAPTPEHSPPATQAQHRPSIHPRGGR